MFADVLQFVRSCPECAVVSGKGEFYVLHYIPSLFYVSPFQIIHEDVMDLPVMTLGNKHVLVFQDLFTKWPMAYPLRTRSLNVL